MLRVRASAVCGALIVFSHRASAEPVVTEQARVETGYLAEARPADQPQLRDVFVSATPELALLWEERASLVTVSYALTGVLHSFDGSSEIDQRLALANRFVATSRTTLVLGATATHSSLTTLLVSDPAARSTITILPNDGGRFLTAAAVQGLTHELSPRVRLDQQADATVATTLAPSPPFDSFAFGGGLALERVWTRDGLGLESRAVYETVRAPPPTPEQKDVTVTLGPRWRHDWTRSLSSLVSAGVTYITAPAAGATPTAMPSARGSVLYTGNETTASLTLETGIAASPLAGPVVYAQLATVQALAPIARSARVYAGGSVSLQHATLLDRTTWTNSHVDGALADTELTWAPSSIVRLFARYQFVTQIGDVDGPNAPPSIVRALVLAGVTLSSRPDARFGAGGGGEPEDVMRLPQRVDRSDAATEHVSSGGTDHDVPVDATPPPPHPPASEEE